MDRLGISPAVWPKPSVASTPLGVVKLDWAIRESVARRLERIRSDMANAGPHYPRDEVRKAIVYWNRTIDAKIYDFV
jgi:hypothetical protein